MQKTKKNKPLEHRCPICDSSQVRYRKFLNNWKCDNKSCGAIFETPASDEGE